MAHRIHSCEPKDEVFDVHKLKSPPETGLPTSPLMVLLSSIAGVLIEIEEATHHTVSITPGSSSKGSDHVRLLKQPVLPKAH